MTAFDLTDPRTPSGRVEADLREAIRTKKLKPGDRLGTYEDLASQYGVDKNTVAVAVRRLKEQRLVYIKRGVGTFVIDQEQLGSVPADESALDEEILTNMDQLHDRLTQIERRVAALEQSQTAAQDGPTV